MNWLAHLVLATGFSAIYLVDSKATTLGTLTAPVSDQANLAVALPGPLIPDFSALPSPAPIVHFCGEAVPLHEEIVARRLIAALARSSGQIKALTRIRQRAAAFFPLIEPILTKYQIPSDFKYLPLVESALVGTAVSPKGAAGYWQLMPATARELGLSVTAYQDDRMNLVRSTDAACRYLRMLHNRLGSWTLAAAAYNIGIGNLLSNIRRQQRRNYYYLRLNAETGKYLYRLLAFKELFTNNLHYRDLLTEPLLASLNQPVESEAAEQANDVLFDETVLVNMEREAVTTPMPAATAATDRPDELPLPNAADVFRGGIKAKLTQPGDLQRGSVWVFNLTRNGLVNDVTVAEGDCLYAVVEDIDSQTGRIFFRADKLHVAGSQQTLALPLAAVDASTGRLGIRLADFDQLKAGWTLTWKVL